MLRILLLIVSLAVSGAAQAQARVGEPVPAFDTRLLEGKALPGAALKGKAVLVVFWATWCPPCQKELPELQALYEQYRSRGFEILALSIDADQFVVEEFWKDHEYAFPVAMKAPAHTQAFGPVRGTPTLYLIDRKGVLRMAHTGPLGRDALEARLKPLL
ncbi:MAG: TlpA family protein disulfide reductase [Zoogloeaceae bacterium]|nr:TlpA family protein disulfide reductase [Zoogloeaceae bacterium]MCK6384581.1 TlpA family protein disulfide reductase [Rhodocyclaceae bacterium]